jgi:hypothetical protein
MQALKLQLMPWLAAVQANPDGFASPRFPALATGMYLNSVLDTPRAFSPLVEMLNGFLWRLTCNSVLSMGSVEARHIMLTFLTHGKFTITTASYFGAIIPGRLCPSFSYHFMVGDCWPTRSDPLEDLIKALFLSERFLDFDPLVIDLYMDKHPPLTLVTKDQKSTNAHKSCTPKRS